MPRRRKYTRRRHHSKYALAKRAVNAVLKKRTEVKSFSFAWALSIGNTPLNYNPIGINLFDYIGQGTNDEERIGNRINCLSTSIRCNLESADSPYNQLRVLVFSTREKLPVDVAGTYYSCSTAFESLNTLGLNAPLNMDVVSRVYMDRLCTLNQLVSGQSVMKFVNKYLRFGKNGKKVVYKGDTSANLGQNTETNFYFVAMSDSSLVPHPRINMVWKNGFIDA